MRTKGCWLRAVLAVSILGFVVSACSDDSDDNNTRSGGGSGTFQCVGATPAAAACCDVGEATIDLCVRCFGVSESVCAGVVDDAIDTASMGQGCSGADEIRDSNELYNECLPAMNTMSCADAESGNMPASCEDQILYVM